MTDPTHLCQRGHFGPPPGRAGCMECHRIRQGVRRTTHRAEILEGKRQYRERNKEKLAAASKKYFAENPVRKRQYRRNRKALERGAAGKHTHDDIQRIRKQQRGRCAYCRNKLGQGFHVDHIVALSCGGSNMPANLQLTCAPCNIRKKARDPIEFAQSTGRLL